MRTGQEKLNDKITSHKRYREGNINPIKYLVDKGADINHIGPDYYTPLMLSIRYYNYSLAKYLIDNGANIDDQCRGVGDTPLHMVIFYAGPFRMCCQTKTLLPHYGQRHFECYTKRANSALGELNGKCSQHQTGSELSVSCKPLQRQSQALLVLKLLLESGADIDIKNYKGKNSLTFAKNIAQNESIEIIEDHIFQKKLLIVQKRLVLSKLFYSSLGENMIEEGLYENISLFV